MQNDDNEHILSESVQEKNKSSENSGAEDSEDEDTIFVPRDPYEWTQENIASWIVWLSKKFKIYPKLEPGRFPQDALELTKFTKACFWVCAGSNVGGNVVAKHYGYLLKNAATGTTPDESLLSEADPGILSVVYIFSILINLEINFFPTFHLISVLRFIFK